MWGDGEGLSSCRALRTTPFSESPDAIHIQQCRFRSEEVVQNPDMTITNKYFGQTAAEYDAKRRHSRTWAAETAAFEKLVHSAMEQGPIKSVLDIPCGTGRWIPFFQDQNVQYRGVDVSKDMIAVAMTNVGGGDTANIQLIEHDCFQYLPAHRNEFDLTISTRFLNWWHTDTAISIIEALCAASRKFVIIHIRVHENALQVTFRRIVKWPKFVGKYAKAVAGALRKGRLTFKHNVLDIESHPRKTVEDRIKALGWTIQERIVAKRLAYAKVEFWLMRKDEAHRSPPP